MQKDHLVGGDGGGVQGHTPGPWWVAESGVRDRGGYIAFSLTTTHWPEQDERYAREVLERKANARLIAAAPELLEALNNILVGMEASGGWEGDDELFNAGVAAYKKATEAKP